LSFNGSSSYVDLGNPALLQITGSMTWSAWVKAAANLPDDGQIVAKSNDASGWQFKTSPDTGSHTFSVGVAGATNTFAQRYSTTVRSLNVWYYVAGVYNASARTLDIYVNGVLNNGTLSGTIPASQINSAVNVNIGRRSGGYYFNGVIDDVRIYSRALSQAEIQADMNTPVGSPAGPPDTEAPSTPGNLVATAIGVSQLHLSWTASTDNVAVAGYLMERQDPGNQSFVQVGTSTDTSYNDTGLVAGSSYSYRARATDAAQNLSQYSGVASATMQAGPAASDNFNRADGGLGVNWAKPAPASEQTLVILNNQVTPNIEDAHCYAYWTRDTFSQDQYSQVQIINVGSWNGVIVRAQSAVDRFYMAFVIGTNDYRIYLRKDGSYYSLSTGSTETWMPGDIIRLEAAGLNPVQLRLLRNGNPVLTYTDATENLLGGSPGIGIYSPSGDHLTIDNWEGGNLGLMGMLGMLAPEAQEPSVRGNLVATALGVSQVKLTWTASMDNVGVTKYEVERLDPGSTSFAQVGTTTGTSYNDTGLAAGSDYSYRVLVRDARGSLNEYSGVVSVTTGSPTIVPRRSR
jgi:chitodextrinase